jgi:hypothetical protein
MVARLLFDSVSLAQNPKSAENEVSKLRDEAIPKSLTDFYIADTVEQHVVTLDVSVDNVLRMQVC